MVYALKGRWTLLSIEPRELQDGPARLHETAGIFEQLRGLRVFYGAHKFMGFLSRFGHGRHCGQREYVLGASKCQACNSTIASPRTVSGSMPIWTSTGLTGGTAAGQFGFVTPMKNG
jgi:hypothetical protein